MNIKQSGVGRAIMQSDADGITGFELLDGAKHSAFAGEGQYVASLENTQWPECLKPTVFAFHTASGFANQTALQGNQRLPAALKMA